MTVARGTGADAHTIVTFENFLPTLTEGVRVDPASINGVANEPFLTGDGSVRFTLELKSAVSAYSNALGVYKVAADGTIFDVDIIFDNTLNVAGAARTVDLGVPGNNEKIGFFLIQDGFDLYGNLPDNLSFVTPGTNTPADLDSGLPPVLHSATLGDLTSAADLPLLRDLQSRRRQSGPVRRRAGRPRTADRFRGSAERDAATTTFRMSSSASGPFTTVILIL